MQQTKKKVKLGKVVFLCLQHIWYPQIPKWN